MSHQLVILLLVAMHAGIALPALGADAPAAEQVEFFEKRIRPLLASECFQCHGADKQRGGLRLDAHADLLEGGDSGPAVVPGEPDESRLIRAVRHDGDLRMPPKKKLTEDQAGVLAAWVKMGAPWPVSAAPARPVADSGMTVTAKDRQFWSFQPVRVPSLPTVKSAPWARSPVDHFVLAKLEEQGLHPAEPADKRTLLRRVTFDLIGLPPAPEECDAFLADESPGAFARVVDRLLAAPQYGERWARHWLDVARYGEDQAHTFQARKYPDGFRYRDWVVRSFNSDLPYDRFIKEQIAGDLLEDGPPADRLAALGLLALGPAYYGKSAADELDDRVDTVCRGVLGLTVACARCHDHKFDPIPQRDYYSLQGIFASTEYKEYVLAGDGGIDEKAVQDPVDKMVRDKKNKEPRKPVVHAVKEGAKQADARIHLRGDPQSLGDAVPRRFLAVLSAETPAPFTKGSGRRELAQEIASNENPLTARVIVNRVWMHHFGRGIVATPSNFGALGERPSHPELLDWLAARFMAWGWSLKDLHREILLSATYQMSSRYDENCAKADPDNRCLWRMNRRRLEVEPWRDAMLAVSDNLDRTLGGPSVDLGLLQNRRRTLYGAISRHNLDPLLRLFDFPDPNLTSDRRPVTSVPLQQLFVLNSEFLGQQSELLARRVTAATSDDAARIRYAHLVAFNRPVSEPELAAGLRFLSSAEGNAWEKYAHALLSSNEFAFVD